MLNRFDCVLRNQHTGSSSRRVAGKTLLLCAVAALLIGPGTIKSAPAAPVLQSCRLHTSLNMGDILSGATARRFGQINGPTAVHRYAIAEHEQTHHAVRL